MPSYNEKVIILRHIVSFKTMEVDKANVESIFKIPMSKMRKDIYSFLRHVTFYRLFIKDFSNIVKPLSHIHVQDIHLNGCMHARYYTTHSRRCSPQRPYCNLWIEYYHSRLCDASNYVIGAVLRQQESYMVSMLANSLMMCK